MLKNIELGENIAQMLLTLIEASEYLLNCHANQNYAGYDSVISDMLFMLESINPVTKTLIEDEPLLNIDKTIPSLLYSLKRIANIEAPKAEQKLEFEFVPMAKGAHMYFYYWGLVYPDKEKMLAYEQQETPDIYKHKKLDEYRRTGKYKYEVSIQVLAYDKLEYTKLCVESVLKYVPDGLNYELILINHGSSDGTQQYFESVHPTKQLDFLLNGALCAVPGMYEGRYLVGISNDVVVTKNAIENMLICMKSDEKIVRVVPTTPNISNLQTIPGSYSSMEEMFEFAEKNNISDKYRWERRARLCDPITIVDLDKEPIARSLDVLYKTLAPSFNTFPDDKMSYIANTQGVKLMLAKDAYCHHFGSVTLGKEIEETNARMNQNFYDEGRKAFKQVFGVDPWGTGFCYDPYLFEILPCDDKGEVNILGVNSGLGSNPLKVQQSIKENAHNFNAKLYNTTNDPAYIENLRGLSDEFEFSKNIESLTGVFSEIEFDYIVVDSGLDFCKNAVAIIQAFMRRLRQRGYFAIYTEKITLKNMLKGIYEVKQNENWMVWQK